MDIPPENLNILKNITMELGKNHSFKFNICMLSFECADNIKQHIQTFHKEELKTQFRKGALDSVEHHHPNKFWSNEYERIEICKEKQKNKYKEKETQTENVPKRKLYI